MDQEMRRNFKIHHRQLEAELIEPEPSEDGDQGENQLNEDCSLIASKKAY